MLSSSEDQNLKVSIVMPCLNEILSLPHCIENAKETLKILKDKYRFDGEIIISDNGSDDGSQQYAIENDCRLVHANIRGYGSAIITGCNEALGDFILIGDADGSYNFLDGIPMIEKLQTGFDICLGNRFKGEIKPGAMPWKNKYIGNPVLSTILKILYKTSIGDSHCGLRAITSSAFQKLNLSTSGMEFASEMVVKSSLLKLKETEVPINLHPDLRDRSPHLKPIRDGLRHLRFMFMLNPTWCFFLPSLLILLPAFLVFASLLFTPYNKMANIFGFPFGDHWLILSSSLITVAYSGILLGLLSSKRNYQLGLYSNNNFYQKIISFTKADRILVFGLLALFIGFIVIGVLTKFYFAGELYITVKHREMMLGTLLLGVGLKSIFWYFVFSLYE